MRADGIARVHTAFSAVPAARFVQDAITAASDTVWQAIEDRPSIYVCGEGRRMAPVETTDQEQGASI